MRILGIDLGKKKVGIAIADKTAMISNPLKVISREELIQELAKIIKEEKITDIVMGFPKNMNNTLGESAQEAVEVKEKIEEKFAVNVFLQDERRTSIAASEIMKKSNMSRKNRKLKIDEMAAAIILQNYLDRRNKNGRENDI